jgi:hypothetical protein
MFAKWEESVENMMVAMFDIPLKLESWNNGGPIQRLWNVIDNGTMAADNFSFNTTGLPELVLKAAFARLIPELWKIGQFRAPL